MFQKLKDALLCFCLGFVAMIFLTASMLGGDISIAIPMIIVLVIFGAWVKQLKYIHFINLIAFLIPIIYLLSDMKLGLPAFIAGVVAFLLGGGLRYLFTTVSFYKSAKKNL